MNPANRGELLLPCPSGLTASAKAERLGSTLQVRVIVNPMAGGGAAARARLHVQALLRKHEMEAAFVESRSTQHVCELAASARADGYNALAVLGGDGTFHHAVNAAWPSGIAFAFFPAGNGNDIARGLRLPLDPVAAAHQFARAAGRPARTVDLVRARVADGSEHVFLAAGGLGLDGLTAHLVNGRFKPLPGAARYVAAALWSLRNFRPFEMEVTLDGREPFRFGLALFGAVANGPVYGSGVCVAPMAQMDDGLLELTLIPDLAFLRVLEALTIVLTSGNLTWPEVRRERARTICLRPVQASQRLLFHGDGEVLGEAPVEVEIAPRALRIIQ